MAFSSYRRLIALSKIKVFGGLAFAAGVGLFGVATFSASRLPAAAQPVSNFPSIVLAAADTPADAASAPDIKATDKWAYAPPSGGVRTVPEMAFTLPGDIDRHMPNPFQFIDYQPLRFADISSGIAFVSEAPAKNTGKSYFLKKFDLKAHRVAGTWLDPTFSHAIDVSIDGKRVVLMGATELDKPAHPEDRLQIVDVTVDPPKVIVSTVPYGLEDKDKRNVMFASLIDDDHLLTMNNDHRIVMWKLPEMKAIYSHRLADSLCNEITLSPDRKFFVTEENDPKSPRVSTRITLFDALTGEGRGSIPFYVPGDPWHAYLVSHVFSPDGKFLLHRHAGGITIFAIDAPQPTKVLDIGTPMGVKDGGINHALFAAPGYLLINDRYLYDIDKQYVVWRYEKLEKNRYCPLGDRFLACGDQRRPEESLAFATFQLPDAATRAALDKIDLAKSYVIKPGDKVTIDVHLSGKSEDNQKIADSFKKQLQDNGMIVAEGQPIKLEVSREVLGTRDMHYEGVTNPAVGGTAHVAATRTTVAFTIDGKVVWSNARVNGGAPGLLTVKEGESLDAAAAKQAIQTPVVDFVLPKLVPTLRDPVGFGVTDMSAMMKKRGG